MQQRYARHVVIAHTTAVGGMYKLGYPGVLPVHDVGVDPSGRLFFTMHLVRGHDLGRIAELAREERDGWNLQRTVGVLVRVCETLAYAHSKGVIHRDLKPSNVMVGRLGEAYVMDWGLARIEGHEDVHAPSFESLGLPADAREAQGAGEAGQVGLEVGLKACGVEIGRCARGLLGHVAGPCCGGG